MDGWIRHTKSVRTLGHSYQCTDVAWELPQGTQLITWTMYFLYGPRNITQSHKMMKDTDAYLEFWAGSVI